MTHVLIPISLGSYMKQALLLDTIVIPVEKESPSLNSGDVDIDCKYIQQINAAQHKRNHALQLQVAQIYQDLAEKALKEKKEAQSALQDHIKEVQWREI